MTSKIVYCVVSRAGEKIFEWPTGDRKLSRDASAFIAGRPFRETARSSGTVSGRPVFCTSVSGVTCACIVEASEGGGGDTSVVWPFLDHVRSLVSLRSRGALVRVEDDMTRHVSRLAALYGDVSANSREIEDDLRSVLDALAESHAVNAGDERAPLVSSSELPTVRPDLRESKTHRRRTCIILAASTTTFVAILIGGSVGIVVGICGGFDFSRCIDNHSSHPWT